MEPVDLIGEFCLMRLPIADVANTIVFGAHGPEERNFDGQVVKVVAAGIRSAAHA